MEGLAMQLVGCCGELWLPRSGRACMVHGVVLLDQQWALLWFLGGLCAGLWHSGSCGSFVWPDSFSALLCSTRCVRYCTLGLPSAAYPPFLMGYCMLPAGQCACFFSSLLDDCLVFCWLPAMLAVHICSCMKALTPLKTAGFMSEVT